MEEINKLKKEFIDASKAILDVGVQETQIKDRIQDAKQALERRNHAPKILLAVQRADFLDPVALRLAAIQQQEHREQATHADR